MRTRWFPCRLSAALPAFVAVSLTLGNLCALAQDAGGGNGGGNENGGGGGQAVMIAPSHSYLLDYLIVGALFGGAIFAICRSSRRS